MQSNTEIEFYNSRLNTDILDYPNYWETTDTIKNIIFKFNHIDEGTRLHDNHESLIGRIMLKRASGKKLYFYTLQSSQLREALNHGDNFHPEAANSRLLQPRDQRHRPRSAPVLPRFASSLRSAQTYSP